MSESEDFLARWSRLKRAAASVGSGGADQAPVAAPPLVCAPPVAAFDPASLPPIELIDAATDVRPFLEACVPEDLARAALRSTWKSDPAIRDFIGIAESQWDFNDPASIPGFAIEAVADYLCGLAPRPEVSSRIPEQPISQDSDSAGSDPPDVGCQATATVTGGSLEPAVSAPTVDSNAGDPGAPLRRSHGSALPR